ncbi:trichome birefringence-like protein 42 [Tanacetum coccineum]|uniref:Trichome birefringence-like protein 42 n=1 Tax=Tanacetum coccineum TaxID=301880 RepID=A0ABQ4X3P7_9ASTR
MDWSCAPPKKSRLVAKGYTQTQGLDYEETFSPVAYIRAIRILIAIAAYYDYEIWQMDVKTAFLNGYLKCEEVYMEQPEGFVNPKYPNRVCKLKRSIYGLKQASRQWNKRFDDEIKKFGFSQNADEPCVYLKASGSNVTFLILFSEAAYILEYPKESTEPIMKYLWNTKDMFLVYGGDLKRELRVSCYTDDGYLTDADDLKSLDIAEFIAAFDASKEAVWVRKFIYGLGARHFCAKVHYLREVIEFGDIKLEKVHTDDNLVDRLLKLTTQGGAANGDERKCNLFKGRWVWDESKTYPLYKGSECPFINPGLNCQKNGRPDNMYLNFRWQPYACSLPRFDGEDFLRRNREKKIMFVGDSLSSNQWQSLACMLYNPDQRYSPSLAHQGSFSTIFFPEHGVTIMYLKNGFLVDLMIEEKGRRVLRLDSISRGSKWEEADILIFNSYHWWIHGGPLKTWDYYRVGERLYRDIPLMDAYKIAMTTWARWVDSNINHTKTRVFFQGISAAHYEGKDWGAPSAENCNGQTEPIQGSNYPGMRYIAEQVVTDVIAKMKNPAYLLDITLLTQLRKDGHPSKYAGGALDCSHWCLAGVPDTWNQILYTILLKD